MIIMRRFINGLLAVCLAATCAAIFTACEPNVPDDERNNGIDTSETGNNENNHATGDHHTGYENGLDTGYENNHTNDYENGFTNDYENGLDTENEHEHENGLDTNELPGDLDPLSRLNFHRGRRDASPVSLNVTANANLSTKKIGWGLGSEVDERNRPLDAISANERYGDFGAMFIGEREPVIHLTFDEGYENGYTASILDTLKARRAKATFFVTYDYCKNEPELVRRMIDEGHTVGNHTYKHPSLPDCSPERIREEIGKLHEYVLDNFGYEMNVIRPPMGEFSEQSLAVTREMGYTSVFWSFAYMDWNIKSQPCPVASLTKIKSATHPGAIVLLHAVSETNAAILGDVIDYWHGQGYSLSAL
jgi:peptidoglycan-N-acetylmuramic acid deacetylase